MSHYALEEPVFGIRAHALGHRHIRPRKRYGHVNTEGKFYAMDQAILLGLKGRALFNLHLFVSM